MEFQILWVHNVHVRLVCARLQFCLSNSHHIVYVLFSVVSGVFGHGSKEPDEIYLYLNKVAIPEHIARDGLRPPSGRVKLNESIRQTLQSALPLGWTR